MPGYIPVGGNGGAGEVIEIIDKTIMTGTRIDMTLGRYGLSYNDYGAYGVAKPAGLYAGRNGENTTVTITAETPIVAIGGGGGGDRLFRFICGAPLPFRDGTVSVVDLAVAADRVRAHSAASPRQHHHSRTVCLALRVP